MSIIRDIIIILYLSLLPQISHGTLIRKHLWHILINTHTHTSAAHIPLNVVHALFSNSKCHNLLLFSFIPSFSNKYIPIYA